MAKIQKITAAENLLQAAKKTGFNFREYAQRQDYSISSAIIEGTTLGEKRASLKILISDMFNNVIFAIVKKGNVIGAKSVKTNVQTIIPTINNVLDKLFERGKITEAEHNFVKGQLPF